MADVDPTATARPTPGRASKGRGRVRFNKAMRVARRAHLYAGLFMAPWVFLYGISAALFNHPDFLADQGVTYLDPVAAGDASGAAPTAAVGLAERVVEGLNRGAAAVKGDAGPAFRLVRADEAAFNRDLIATARGDGRTFTVRVDLGDGSGSAREVAKRAPVPAPTLPKGGVKLDPAPFEPVLRRLPAALKTRGLPADEAFVRTAPDLAFFAEGQGRTWRMTYNGQTGAISGRPAEVPNVPPTARRSMLLMHVAHTFPSDVNARWIWAVAVDVMAVSMVGWGVTGLLMWWQMKNVRLAGVVVLLVSLVAATALAAAMHATFAAEGLT